MTGAPSTLSAIRALLDTGGIAYRHVEHAPTFTSEESAAARGEPVRIGGKALVIRMAETYRLFVLSAALKLDSAAVRRRFNTRVSRFATRAELLELTSLVPGSVPPFGEPVLQLPLFVDTSILNNDRIAFNAGSLTDSIIMNVEDYLAVAQPTVFTFSRS